MDAPKLSARVERLKKGEAKNIDLFALFNEKVLDDNRRDESHRPGDRRLQESPDRDARDTETLTIEMYDRNALRWDDDRKIAAFVTAKDDEVLMFAKSAAAVLGDGAAARGQRPTFRKDDALRCAGRTGGHLRRRPVIVLQGPLRRRRARRLTTSSFRGRR